MSACCAYDPGLLLYAMTADETEFSPGEDGLGALLALLTSGSVVALLALIS